MRLGLISAKYPFGIQEAYLDAELRALAPAFERIVVVPTSPASRTAHFTAVPAEVVRLPLAGAATLLRALRAFARRPGRALAVLATIVREPYPARVKVKNLAVYAKGLAVADVALRGRVDHLHAYWLSTPATVAWIASRVSGIPFSATAHRWDVYENNLAARKLRDARFVRAISERGRRDLLAQTRGDPNKVHVVRVGVALPALRQAQDDTAGTHRVLRILCAAAFVPVKGHDVLVSALRLLRERGVAFTATLAGEGPLREDVARTVREAKLSGVELPGAVPHDALLASLGRGDFDVAVIASVERGGGLMEGIPVALIEAMAAGTPVVATNSGSIGELVDGSTGLLVPHSDPPALAAALERIAREPGLAARLRGAARARVERDFDVACTTERLRSLMALRVAHPAAG